MVRKIICGCFAIAFWCSIKQVNAASTCDYSEQVSLNSAASVVQTNVSVKKVVLDINGFEVPDANPDDVDEFGEYIVDTRLSVQILNITDDVYVLVKGDNGIEQTYYYANSNNGMIEFHGGDLSKIVNYKITVYSNSDNCKGEVLRTIDVVTPMFNSFSEYNSCLTIPDYLYCQEYITSPFYISDDEITQQILEEYHKQRDKEILEEENKEEKSFLDNIRDFYQNHKIVIFSAIGGVIVIGALVTVVILRKQRSRIL